MGKIANGAFFFSLTFPMHCRIFFLVLTPSPKRIWWGPSVAPKTCQKRHIDWKSRARKSWGMQGRGGEGARPLPVSFFFFLADQNKNETRSFNYYYYLFICLLGDISAPFVAGLPPFREIDLGGGTMLEIELKK